MLSLIRAFILSKDKDLIIKRNIFFLFAFTVLYYFSLVIAKKLNMEVNEDYFNWIDCFYFSLITQTGVGYIMPYTNSVSYAVNMVHIILIFLMGIGIIL